MSKPAAGSYINIPLWRGQNLGLTPAQNFIYSVIRNFSNSDKTFVGGAEYIATATNTSRVTVNTILKELLKKGLIRKEEHSGIGCIKYYEYSAVPLSELGLVDDRPPEDLDDTQKGTHEIKNLSRTCKETYHGTCKETYHGTCKETYHNTIYNNISNNKEKEYTVAPDVQHPTPEKEKNVFVKPTVQQVQEYCKFRNNDIDPEYFYDLYETNGWKTSRGEPMKDWKKMVRLWEKADSNNIPQTVEEVREYAKEIHSNTSPSRFYNYYSDKGWKLPDGRRIKNWKAKFREWTEEDRDKPIKPGQVQPDPNRTSIDFDEIDAYMKNSSIDSPSFWANNPTTDQPGEQADIQPEPVQADYEPIPDDQADGSTLITADPVDQSDSSTPKADSLPINDESVAADQSDSSTQTADNQPDEPNQTMTEPDQVAAEKEAQVSKKLFVQICGAWEVPDSDHAYEVFNEWGFPKDWTGLLMEYSKSGWPAEWAARMGSQQKQSIAQIDR